MDSLITAAIRDETIRGYRKEISTDFSQDANHKNLVRERTYSNKNNIISVYSYKNLKSEDVTLREQMFLLNSNVIAVGIEKKTLVPSETTKVVVVEDAGKNS